MRRTWSIRGCCAIGKRNCKTIFGNKGNKLIRQWILEKAKRLQGLRSISISNNNIIVR
jgi:hypothetical protein